MKIFHHNDLDGQCAASLVKRKYPECVESDFVSMVYEKSFPFELLDDGPCYILDFSLEPADMETLMNQLNGNVIWIDHHKSAIDKYQDFRYEVPGVRDVKDAGCVLTWRRLFPEQEVPLYVQYVGDRDAWKWELGGQLPSAKAEGLSGDRQRKS